MFRKVYSLSLLVILTVLLTGCILTEKTYSILFINNGGSIVNAINEPANTPINKPEDPTREGYTFGGWYMDEKFNSSYTFTTMPEVNITLYAKWIINTYTITFESNGGNSIEPITMEYNSLFTLPTPTNHELIFVGWFSDLNLTKYYNNNRIPSKNMTLYAKWTDDDTIKDKEIYRLQVDESIQDAVDAYYGDSGVFNLLPSKGDVKILVIPIQFQDDKFTVSELNQIRYGFFGDGSKYETLKSFYSKSSYGALNISGSVLPAYTAKFNYDFYNYFSSETNPDTSGVDKLIEEFIAYYLKTKPDLDLSIYDSEGDYYIDAVHLVYSAPINYETTESIYWAYQYYYAPTSGTNEEDYVYWGDYGIDAYVFSSIDFFYEYDVENARTIIHETGHLLGLDDYYDYTVEGDNNRGGLGGTDMMDNTMGDHNPFSKLMLDWIDPIVITESTTLTINQFETSGDAILVSRDFDSIFDNYFILSYYTPTNLYEDHPFLTESGLIMYDVRSNLPINYGELSEFSSYLQYNNSDTNFKLITLEEADGKDDISTQNELATNQDLLQLGQKFILGNYNQSLCKVEVIDQTADTITLTFSFYE